MKVRGAGVAAVVVLFNPPDDLADNIRSYLGQVERVIAVDNTPEPAAEIVATLEEMGVVHIALGENRGIGAALNLGCEKAMELGSEFAITLDQDSAAARGMVERLLSCLGEGDSDDVISVVPRLQQVGGLPIELQASCIELSYAITSGAILRLSGAAALGGFREDYFIDQVDHEFCMRARRNGWRILQRRDAVLEHRMGELTQARRPFRFYYTNYSALRRYYMVRNLLETRRVFGSENADWLRDERRQWIKDLPKMFLAEPDKLRKLKFMYQGWRDFRRGRFGRYEDIHLQR